MTDLTFKNDANALSPHYHPTAVATSVIDADDDGERGLLRAAQEGELERVQFGGWESKASLPVKKGATVIAQDHHRQIHAKHKYGWTPLHVAASNKGTEADVASLLERGAEIHARDNDGWTPLHVAANNEETATVALLLKSGANIHARDKDGWTPLHAAADNKGTETVELLLKWGAKIHAKDRDGWTPLHLAATDKGA